MSVYVPNPMEHHDFPKSEINAVLEAMRHVLRYWAYLPYCDVGLPVDGPAKMPLERSVRLSGRSLACLTIRTQPELAELLAHYSQGESKNPGDAEDAFQEFVNIYAGHLMTYLWGDSGKSFDPYLPVPTTPNDWPKPTAAASCAFIVENIPVEVRLWILETH